MHAMLRQFWIAGLFCGAGAVLAAPPSATYKTCAATLQIPTGFQVSSGKENWKVFRSKTGAQLISMCTENKRRTTIAPDLPRRLNRRGKRPHGFMLLGTSGGHRIAVYAIERRSRAQVGYTGHLYVATRSHELRLSHIPGPTAQRNAVAARLPLHRIAKSLRFRATAQVAISESAYRLRLYSFVALLAVALLALLAFGFVRRRRRRRNARLAASAEQSADPSGTD